MRGSRSIWARRLAAAAAVALAVLTSAAAPPPAPVPASASPAPQDAKPAPAPPTPATPAAAQLLDPAAAEQLLARLRNQAPGVTNDGRLAQMEQQAAAIETRADAVVAAHASDLLKAQAELRRLPVRRRPSEAERQRRAQLQAQESAAAAAMSPAKALASSAGQTVSMIAERRRESFSARVLERTASPLTPGFWTSVASAAGADLARLQLLGQRILATALGAPEPRGLGGLAAGLLAALIVVWPIRRWLDRLVFRICHSFVAGGAGRTLALAVRMAIDVAAVVAAVEAVRLGADWGGLLSRAADQLAAAAAGACAWGAAIIAVGRVLATESAAKSRLLPVDDGEAARARVALWSVAFITGGGFLLQRLNFVVGASLSATIAANCVVSVAYAAAAALILISFGRSEPVGTSAQDAATPARGPAWTLISLALAAAIVATVGAVLLGYTTLAALISGQIFWLSLIGSLGYLALRLVDEVFSTLFRQQSRAVRALNRLFGLRSSTLIQFGLLVSAALQVLIILAAVTLALTPFGQSGELFVAHIRRLGAAVHIGKATISPLAVAAGVATFWVGLALSHVVRRWVVRRYLPVTGWDAGVRNSISVGVAYLGVAIALACALAVTGLGFKQIALIASALSVGIGFGLQQIVQNFVAGIILLIERPVKVGDWINVGGAEGGVLNIRVRATELKALDGSVVIVPNSSLITTNVQNKTPGTTHARIDLKVNVAKPGEVAKARDLILQLASAKADVLQNPAPEVYVDALAAAGGANLIAWIHVADPAQAARLRSDLYLEVLDAFQKAGITLL